MEAPSHECDQATAALAPAAKRVRFAMSLSVCLVLVPRYLDTEDEELTKWIFSVIEVNDPAQVEANEIDFFSPAFTYHAFGKEEIIEGYDGLRIELVFNAYDFSALVNVTYKDKEARCDDVLEKLASSLPPGFNTQDKTDFLSALKSSSAERFDAPGTLAASYSQQIDGQERVFDIYECPLEKNDAAQKLHRNLQTMSLWFIEGADAIDVSDPRWVVYILYERASDKRKLAPVGFVTLFKFTNPLGRKAGDSTATETHRICQALIFPTHQRQGHCERLVDLIYDKVQADSNVYEVTVEDPVPGFSRLRDYVDAKHCAKHKFFSLAPSESDDAPAGHGTSSLQPSDIRAVQDALKLTQRQVQRCYELFKLSFVNKTNEDEYKKYRLEVKRRLLKLYAEDVEGMGAERRKAFLETEYRQLEELYETLHRKIRSDQQM